MYIIAEYIDGRFQWLHVILFNRKDFTASQPTNHMFDYGSLFFETKKLGSDRKTVNIVRAKEFMEDRNTRAHYS